nr:hypothetical protein L204_02457 [Cryptococcus depauperatus CBS 7855]
MLKLAQKHAGFATLTRCVLGVSDWDRPHVGVVVVNGGQWLREVYGLRGGGLEGELGTALEAGWPLGVGAAARLCAVLGIGRGSWWMFAYASVAYRIRSRWPADATLKVGVDIWAAVCCCLFPPSQTFLAEVQGDGRGTRRERRRGRQLLPGPHPGRRSRSQDYLDRVVTLVGIDRSEEL